MLVHRAFVCKHKLLFVFAFTLSELNCVRCNTGYQSAFNIRSAIPAARETLPLPGRFEAK